MVLGTLRLKLALCGLALVAPVLSIAQAPAGIEGDWQGTLKSGQSSLRLVLHIARASDGRYFGQMDSVDLGSTTLIDSIQLTGDSVRLELKTIKGTFEGSINAAGNALSGTWNQGSAVSIEFKRAVAVPEAPKPLPRYQPPPTAPPPAPPPSADSEKKLADARVATLAKTKALNDAFNAGMAALTAKNFPVAIQKLEEASQLDATQFVVWGNLADAYTGRSAAETGADREASLRAALAAYQKAIDLKPSDAGLHNNYGLALARLTKIPEAQSELVKAAQLDPSKAGQYYFNLGALLVNSGQVDQAAAAFRKATEADATYSEAYYQLGACLFATKRTNAGAWPDGMQQAFQKYIELSPNGANADTARARLQQMSQPAAARLVGTPVMSKIAIAPCPLDAPAPATQFLSTDRELTMWFRLAGLSGEDTISIRHTEPSGEVSRNYRLTVKPGAGSWPFCVGQANLATMTPGTWSVAVYLNNSTTPLFAPLEFTVQRGHVRRPTPLAEDANLEATMKFIEDGLNAKGRVEFRDPAPGTNAADAALLFDEVTGAAADPRRCELSFHLLSGSIGGVDNLVKLRFADVDNLSVVPRQAQPPVFGLNVHTKTEAILNHLVSRLRKDPATNLFFATPADPEARPDQQRVVSIIHFKDEATAQSMAVAMVHAVELCPSGQ